MSPGTAARSVHAAPSSDTACASPLGMTTSLLVARNVMKRFGHVEALRGINLDIGAEEVVGLVGDNGAGKSTLAKILSGNFSPDGGDILLDGRKVHLSSPRAARAHGIETVYQDLALTPDLDAVANLFLGRELYRSRRLGILDERAMHRHAQHLFDDIGIKIQSLSVPVFRLSGGQRQGIALARAIAWAKRLVVMDEPTAALGVHQSERVMSLVRRLKASGIAVLIISHNLPEVCAVADRIEVFRLGRKVATLPHDAPVTDLMAAMTGFGHMPPAALS